MGARMQSPNTAGSTPNVARSSRPSEEISSVKGNGRMKGIWDHTTQRSTSPTENLTDGLGGGRIRNILTPWLVVSCSSLVVGSFRAFVVFLGCTCVLYKPLFADTLRFNDTLLVNYPLRFCVWCASKAPQRGISGSLRNEANTASRLRVPNKIRSIRGRLNLSFSVRCSIFRSQSAGRT